jgi:hypothetical protein
MNMAIQSINSTIMLTPHASTSGKTHLTNLIWGFHFSQFIYVYEMHPWIEESLINKKCELLDVSTIHHWYHTLKLICNLLINYLHLVSHNCWRWGMSTNPWYWMEGRLILLIVVVVWKEALFLFLNSDLPYLLYKYILNWWGQFQGSKYSVI